MVKVLLFLIAVAILKAFSIKRCPDGPLYTFQSFGKDTITCSIGLNHNMFSKDAGNIGFHYELLKAFGKSFGRSTHISNPSDSSDCWSLLEDGAVDILVVNDTDTVPERFAGKFLKSVPIKGDNVWAVTRENKHLLDEINRWFSYCQSDGLFRRLSHNYFRSYKLDWLINHRDEVKSISPYDDIIRKYSSKVGIDWRLVSAIIYEESQYKMGARSAKSAKGLMQVKSSTAAKYGIDNLYDPESNVKAGTLHFNELLNKYRKEGLDSTNVIKFSLAAYNAGEMWLENRRAFTRKEGLDADDWEIVRKTAVKENSATSIYISNILSTYSTYRTLFDN
ncbi:MAG: transglycosylase SLT domain-containing protein [Bacteroidales bacterium]|nr:transglycosylase SLT domain-containing protein [Candidatus Cacconaster merdequi]